MHILTHGHRHSDFKIIWKRASFIAVLDLGANQPMYLLLFCLKLIFIKLPLLMNLTFSFVPSSNNAKICLLTYVTVTVLHHKILTMLLNVYGTKS